MGFVRHAMWAASLCYMYQLLFSTSKILASSQLTLWPSFDFLADLLSVCVDAYRHARRRSACFIHVTSPTFAGNAGDTMGRLFPVLFS